MKFKYIVVYKNNSYKFDIGHYWICRTKVEVTAYTFYKYCHAWMIIQIPRECLKFRVWTLYLSSGSCLEANTTNVKKMYPTGTWTRVLGLPFQCSDH